ncbi:hypothetical protein BsWGS_02514 [Bradybaena similaris]
MTPPVYTWFMSEVYYWRSLASMLWSVICLPVFLFAFLLLSQFSLIQPVEWVYAVVDGFLSAQFWVAYILYGACLVLVTWFCLPHIAVVPEIEDTYISAYLGLFKWSRLPLLVICALAGTLSAWIVSELIGGRFGSLTHVVNKETHEDVYLSEPHLCIVLGGLFTGLSYCRQFFHRGLYYLTFPSVHRFKLFQARSEMSSLLCNCMWQSLHTVTYFYILYFFFGRVSKSWIHASFNISVDQNAVPLDSLMGLLNLSLLWQTYLCTLLLIFSWSFTRTLVKVFHSQHYEFTIQSVMEYDKENTLSEALACNYSPILQHLAFLDFSRLSKFSASRRQELLTLSQPGGHPRIWTAVSSTALAVIKELTERVKEENWAIMSKAPVSIQRTNTQRSTAYVSSGDPSALIFRGQEEILPVAPESEDQEHIFSSVWGKLSALFFSLPLISHLFAEIPDASSRKLFASCQLQIWAIEGVSHMAEKSYTEDKYGIVQTLLPAIFASFLDLHEAIEKYFKLSSSVFKRPGGSAHSDVLLKYKLHSVNKAAVYRLVNTYKQHLEDIRLNVEYFKKLQPFVDYNI